MSTLWLPGAGVVDLHQRTLAKAANEYDERLELGQDQRTGEWALYVKMERGDDPFFVLALGPRLEEWTPERLTHEIYKRDLQRPYGAKLKDRINAHNERLKRERAAAAADQQLEAAVRLEFINRKASGHDDHVVIPDTQATDNVTKGDK